MHRTEKLVDRIIDGMAVLAGLAVLFIMFSICYEVVVRFFRFQPPAWVTEITEYLLLYITFLGAPWVLREGGHVRVDVVVGKLRRKARRAFDFGTSLTGMLICCALVWFGARTAWDLYERGIPVIKTLAVPKFLLVGIIPVGSLLMIAEFVRRSHRLWRSLKSAEAAGEDSALDSEGL